MVRAYILLETAADKTAAVQASVGHGLKNCLAIGHSLWPSEVIVHLECTNLECLNEAITHDIAQLEGVRRITTCVVVKGGESA
jgi:DNA-binding Lrp family transcriptional regulator